MRYAATRKSDENLQTHPMSGIEQPHRWRREDPHSIDAGFRHQREVLVDHCGFRELRTVTALGEGAIGDALDEMLVLSGEEKLAVHADRDGRIDARRCRQREARRNLVDLDRGHLRSSREACRRDEFLGGGGTCTTGVNEFHSAPA